MGGGAQSVQNTSIDLEPSGQGKAGSHVSKSELEHKETACSYCASDPRSSGPGGTRPVKCRSDNTERSHSGF